MTKDQGVRWTAAHARAALAGAPEISLDQMAPGGGGVLVLAPHPDDETLGCGGLIAHAAKTGREVLIACLTDGAASHPNSRRWPPEQLAALRQTELANAIAILADGVARVESFGAPDGRLSTYSAAATAWLAGIAAEQAFTAVFATWGADPHPDHKACFQIAAQVAEATDAALFAYPVWGLTLPDDADAGPAAACFKLDISQILARKRAAIAAYHSQTGGLIDDDPSGFSLRPEDLARHLRPHESFIRFQTRIRQC